MKALNLLLHCTHILSNIKHCWIQQCWIMLETRVLVETLGTLFSIHTNGTNWQNILACLSGVNEMHSLIGSVGTTCVYLQTCQLSRLYRESHDLLTFPTHSWQDSQCHVFLGNITPKWNVALMKNVAMKLAYLKEMTPCYKLKFHHSGNLFSGLLNKSHQRKSRI